MSISMLRYSPTWLGPVSRVSLRGCCTILRYTFLTLTLLTQSKKSANSLWVYAYCVSPQLADGYFGGLLPSETAFSTNPEAAFKDYVRGP